MGCITPLMAADKWRVTDFEVYFGAPYVNDDPYYQAQIAMGADPDTEIPLCEQYDQAECDRIAADLESFLHDLAIELQNKGFADPTAGTIQSIVTSDNGKKTIRIYLFNFDTVPAVPSDKLGFFANRCEKVLSLDFDTGIRHRGVLMLNARSSLKHGRLTAPGYQNAAHEFFHAVQFASKLRQGEEGCKVSQWITEGTADAIGFDYARKLRNISTDAWDRLVGKLPGFAKAYGGRWYYKPLSSDFPKNSMEYHTSSFWRHLAEWNYAKYRGQDHPGSQEAPFNYSYLAKLFDQPYCCKSELNDLEWLDKWMKSYKYMSGGLAPIYAQFVASLADHMDTRIPVIENLGPWDREPRWHRFLFEDCVEIELSRNAPSKPGYVSIPPAAARCFSVYADSGASETVSLSISNGDLPNGKQKQLRFGAMGGQLVQMPDIRIAQLPAKDAGTSYAGWEFLIRGNRKNVFVVANTATKAQETLAASGEFHFSIPSWDSSLTKKDPAPAGGPAEEQVKTREEVKKHRESLRNNPTTNSLNAVIAGVDYRQPGPGCTDKMQAKNLCGPQLVISLSLDFGIGPGQGPAGAAGGLLKQMGSIGVQSAAEEATIAAGMQQMAVNGKGNLITLSMPAIDYGQSGSAGNVRIEVSGDEGSAYVSVNTLPDEDGVYTPNGSVEIAEYTPHMLRGTFAADLVDVESMKLASRSNPELPVADSVSGSFAVAAPWRGNARLPDASPDSAMMAGAREDMLDILLKIPPDMRASMITGDKLTELCKLGFEDGQLASLGIEGGCGDAAATEASLMPQCDCSCEAFPQMREIPLCQSQCSEHWATAECAILADTEAQENDAELERYASELRQLGLPQDTFDTQVTAFKNAPPELREKFWDDLEITRQTLAEMGAQDIPQARVQNQPSRDLDVETLRFKQAMELAGKPAAEVDGLVTLFSISDAATRQILWTQLQ